MGVSSGAGEAGEAPGFALYPNPAHDWVWLRLERPTWAGALVRVLDVAGREVLALPLPEGLSLAALPVAGLPAGVYAVLGGGLLNWWCGNLRIGLVQTTKAKNSATFFSKRQ